MSGASGHDRTIPAFCMITLKPYAEVDHKTALSMIRYVDWKVAEKIKEGETPDFIVLRINTDNPRKFKKGMEIRIKGYMIKGDESGTWTTYNAIEMK